MQRYRWIVITWRQDSNVNHRWAQGQPGPGGSSAKGHWYSRPNSSKKGKGWLVMGQDQGEMEELAGVYNVWISSWLPEATWAGWYPGMRLSKFMVRTARDRLFVRRTVLSLTVVMCYIPLQAFPPDKNEILFWKLFNFVLKVCLNPIQSLCLNDQRGSSFTGEIFAENSAVVGGAALPLSSYSHKWPSLLIRGQMLGKRWRDKEVWMWMCGSADR